MIVITTEFRTALFYTCLRPPSTVPLRGIDVKPFKSYALFVHTHLQTASTGFDTSLTVKKLPLPR